MLHKNVLKDLISIEKLKKDETFFDKYINQEREYKLSFHDKDDNELDPQYMGITEIETYISNNYISSRFIDRSKLLNDLIVFKTYKEKLELVIGKQELLINTIAVQVAIYGIVINFYAKDKFTKKVIIIELCILILLMISTDILYYIFRVTKNSEFNELKTISNVLNFLETLKEDLYNPVEVLEYKDFDLEVSNIEEGIVTNIYSVKVTEILEDESK